jgi:hypothetical protein
MKSRFLVFIGAVALTIWSSTVSAEQVKMRLLQCVPQPPVTTPALPVTCPPVANGMVDLEACSCPENYLLVETSQPGSIDVGVISPS